ncbi:hypothetical protein MGSAQ_001932 [marine sediment metagenome]|uniref:Uncharacterized protein n=1 Tax=marine sediment metagenome TaxID=412755 RepID=A0A1B6NSX4_9ZZZZ
MIFYKVTPFLFFARSDVISSNAIRFASTHSRGTTCDV